MSVLALAGTLWAQRDSKGLLLAAVGLGGAVAVKSMAAAPLGLALAPWLFYAAYKHKRYVTLAKSFTVL